MYLLKSVYGLLPEDLKNGGSQYEILTEFAFHNEKKKRYHTIYF